MKPWVAVPLTGKRGQGRFALIDAEDVHLIAGRKWHDNGGYATSTLTLARDGRRGGVTMHRIILGAVAGQIVDHANGNTLDNRRANLRLATTALNSANTVTRRVTGVYRGVVKCKGGWAARCQHGPITRHGVRKSEVAAARLYDKFARELHGQFAVLNFPKAGERDAFEARAA